MSNRARRRDLLADPLSLAELSYPSSSSPSLLSSVSYRPSQSEATRPSPTLSPPPARLSVVLVRASHPSSTRSPILSLSLCLSSVWDWSCRLTRFPGELSAELSNKRRQLIDSLNSIQLAPLDKVVALLQSIAMFYVAYPAAVATGQVLLQTSPPGPSAQMAAIESGVRDVCSFILADGTSR